ncbi:hypothetical protein WH47_11741 [Habropoda laboriosa]|uniref:Uncharacterized protein n=1 Tax=Habropoda laboriosa TaxID=597456 RepID=A0A0L7R8D0_9HYME|nr:hypothetical protein WH47_11741 [Habropoda laboriosa]
MEKCRDRRRERWLHSQSRRCIVIRGPSFLSDHTANVLSCNRVDSFRFRGL